MLHVEFSLYYLKHTLLYYQNVLPFADNAKVICVKLKSVLCYSNVTVHTVQYYAARTEANMLTGIPEALPLVV